MEQPLVSVITPMYNSEKFINETIETVVNQTYKNWEWIVIDDCSDDKSVGMIEEYSKKDKRIKLLKNKQNLGPAGSRNKGFDEANGGYIALLDSDDLWKKEKLEKQIKFMQKEELDISHTSYYFVNEQGEIISKIAPKFEIGYKELLKNNEFKTMAMVISKEALGETRMPAIKHEDYAFFLDILKKGYRSKLYSQSTSYCRLREGSVSSDKFKSAIWRWNIYRKYEKCNVLRTCYYFVHYMLTAIKKYKKI